jgi:hypothetical protein
VQVAYAARIADRSFIQHRRVSAPICLTASKRLEPTIPARLVEEVRRVMAWEGCNSVVGGAAFCFRALRRLLTLVPIGDLPHFLERL